MGITAPTIPLIAFSPLARIISAITNANPGVVTTTEDHGYLSDIIVRIVLPANFGMSQVNNQLFTITVLSPTTFSIGVDTTHYDTFTSVSTQSGQVIPIGNLQKGLLEPEKNAETPIGGN